MTPREVARLHALVPAALDGDLVAGAGLVATGGGSILPGRLER